MKKSQDDWWKYAQIGLELAFSVLGGFALGYWLDEKMGTRPWLMLAGVFVFMAAGFYLVARELFPQDKGGGKGEE